MYPVSVTKTASMIRSSHRRHSSRCMLESEADQFFQSIRTFVETNHFVDLLHHLSSVIVGFAGGEEHMPSGRIVWRSSRVHEAPLDTKSELKTVCSHRKLNPVGTYLINLSL